MQPLLGRYSASLLDALEAQLATAAPMREVAGQLGARVARRGRAASRSATRRACCLNINTPDELAAAGG